MRYSADKLSGIDLGRQGENLARTIEIDVSSLRCCPHVWREAEESARSFTTSAGGLGAVTPDGGCSCFGCSQPRPALRTHHPLHGQGVVAGADKRWF